MRLRRKRKLKWNKQISNLFKTMSKMFYDIIPPKTGNGKFVRKRKARIFRPGFGIIKTSIVKIVVLLVILSLNWFGFSAVLKTKAYFNNTENSAGNNFIAGSLNFELNSSSDFSPLPILPGQSTTKTVSFINSNNIPKYTVNAANFVGELCDYLNLDANLDGGTSEYNGNLKDFTYEPVLFSEPDDWIFTVSLPADAPLNLQNQTCQFKFVFFGSQERNDLPFGEGFNDNEEIDNTITAGEWQKIVINKVYYDPDCEHSGNGPEKKYEWIELYNPMDYDISLKKWEICDNYECATIDQNISIPAFGFAVITHDAEVWKYWEIVDGVVTTYTLSGNFEMNDTADMLILKDADGNIIDQMNWGIPDENWNNYNSDVWNPGVPDVARGNMLGRVPSGFDTDQPSDWHDLVLPEVTVLIPNGGETWYVGRNYTVEWTATNPNGSDTDLIIDIWFSNNSGNTWAKVAEREANDGSYEWRVPLCLDDGSGLCYSTVTHKGRIKVVAFGPENFMVQGWDMSDDDFCPPIDYILLTDEEKVMLEDLIAQGLISSDEIINREIINTEPLISGGISINNSQSTEEMITPVSDADGIGTGQAPVEETLVEETPVENPSDVGTETPAVEEQPVEQIVEQPAEQSTEQPPAEIITESTPAIETTPTTDVPAAEVPAGDTGGTDAGAAAPIVSGSVGGSGEVVTP